MTRNSLHVFVNREALLLTAASMFLGLSVSLMLQSVLVAFDKVTLINRLIMLLGELSILIIPYLILKQRGKGLRQVLPLKPIAPLTWMMALVMTLGAIGMVSIFELLILPYFPAPAFLQQLESDLTRGNLFDMMILIVAGSLVAPVIEEFIFRGILQQSLFYHFGSILPAMVVPTVIFALFHFPYLFYLPATIELIMLALLLGWLMAKTGNLLIPIMVHGVFNLSSFADLFSPELEEATSLSEFGWMWVILSAFLLTAGWFYFKHIQVAVFDEVFLIPPLKEERI